MNPQKLGLSDAQTRLRQSGHEFLSLFVHGTMEVELYKPDKVDRQPPHDKDEIYIIATGSGKFEMAGEIVDFRSGDFLFVPKQVEHRFFDFSDDFSTWVIFYAP